MSRNINWQHPLIALSAALAVVILGAPVLCCFAVPVFFTGREHTQAEYRWIETFGRHRRANMPWWGGFDRRVWDVHSWWWNLLLPWLIAAAVAAVAMIWR